APGGRAQATSQDVAQKAQSATPVFSPPAHSIAVLPFVNMSGDAKQDYFSDGISEELLNALSRLNDLQVVARTSSFAFKGKDVDVPTIARRLNVGAILEGSVRRAGNTVRITAQLINTVTGFHLWSDTYDRPFTDIFKIQTEVATAVAQQLETRLAGDEPIRLEVGGTKNPAAYEDFLQGLQALNLRTKAGFEQAIADFSSAVARDPRYAIAYAELARTYSLAPIFGISTPTETMPKARDAATRALALNQDLADAHTALGFIMAHFEFDWPAAEREYLRGLALNPSDAQGHFYYSNSYLSPFGRHEEAIAEMKKAAELDPLSPAIQAFMGRTYLWARRFDEALAQFKKSNDLNPNLAVGHERLAHLYTYLGRFNDAIDEESTARRLSGEDPQMVRSREEALRKALTADGGQGYWRTLLDFATVRPNPPEAYDDSYGIAIIYARLGDQAKAIDSLESAYAERELAMTEIGVEPAFDVLRSDARFQGLLRRVGLAR
ncbi:MAG: tetratricopeptide repeat protein, partial [Steroidobacteraceae bacterium]